MSKSLVVINSSPANSCGACASGGCSTCGPTLVQKGAAPMTRRSFGYATLVGSAAAFLTGCSKQEGSAPASAPEASAPAAPALSSDLEVVKQAKGPIMTTL